MPEFKRGKMSHLFSMPSFLSGAARTLDLFGQFDEYNQSPTPREDDARAMIEDMMVVASDIGAVIKVDRRKK